MNEKELEKLKALNIKIEIYLNLRRFCEKESTHAMDRNKECDDCKIYYFIKKLEKEIFLE
jgi:hypothetical protein